MKQLPDLVWSLFNTAITNISDLISNIFDTVKALPSAILDAIKRIFIPDTDKIQSSIDTLSNNFKSAFGVDSYDISSVFGTETEITNQSGTISFAGYEFTSVFLDVTFLVNAVSTFRPVIRGFVIFLLILYNINQFLAFIKQNPIAVGVHMPIQSSTDVPLLPSLSNFPKLKG